MRTIRATVAAVAVLVLCGCGTDPVAAGAQTGPITPLNCTETPATPAGARPPVLAANTISWYGASDLWVGLPDHPATMQGDAIVLKFPWVTLAGDQPTADLGVPEVSAARTGAPGQVAATFAEYTRSFGTGSLSFWPATIEFPEAGCWTVTGRLRSTTVQFAILVTEP